MNSSDQREASWFAAAAGILCVLISFLFFYIDFHMGFLNTGSSINRCWVRRLLCYSQPFFPACVRRAYRCPLIYVWSLVSF